MQDHKDVEIDGKRYRVGRFTARTGSWMITQLLTKVMPSLVGGRLSMLKLPASGASMTEDDFIGIQNHCLRVCGIYNAEATNVFVPIMKGETLLKDLEYDLGTVLALTVHTLEFNFRDFFEKGGMSALQSLSGLSSARSTPSETDSSSDQS